MNMYIYICSLSLYMYKYVWLSLCVCMCEWKCVCLLVYLYKSIYMFLVKYHFNTPWFSTYINGFYSILHLTKKLCHNYNISFSSVTLTHFFLIFAQFALLQCIITALKTDVFIYIISDSLLPHENQIFIPLLQVLCVVKILVVKFHATELTHVVNHMTHFALPVQLNVQQVRKSFS